MKKRYNLLDATTFEPTGRVIWLDLDDPLATGRVIFDADLGAGMGPAAQVDFGRHVDESRAAAESAGVFSTGEAPPRREREYPAARGSKVDAPVLGVPANPGPSPQPLVDRTSPEARRAQIARGAKRLGMDRL